MLKTPEEEAGLTPIEKELNRSFGFVHNLAAAAALGLILERLAEAELAIDLYGDDEDHALMIPIVEKYWIYPL